MSMDQKEPEEKVKEMKGLVIPYINDFLEDPDQYIVNLDLPEKKEILIKLYDKIHRSASIGINDVAPLLRLTEDDYVKLSISKGLTDKFNEKSEQFKDEYVHLGTNATPGRLGGKYITDSDDESSKE